MKPLKKAQLIRLANYTTLRDIKKTKLFSNIMGVNTIDLTNTQAPIYSEASCVGLEIEVCELEGSSFNSIKQTSRPFIAKCKQTPSDYINAQREAIRI
ncbi:MAG: hypothetical protein AB9856_01865 [Cellulosilyticaceae bacterium]